jgi:hypothetical protein
MSTVESLTLLPSWSSSVGGLQRDAAVGEGGTDLDHVSTVTRDHAREGGPGAVDEAEEVDGDGALEVRGFGREEVPEDADRSVAADRWTEGRGEVVVVRGMTPR